MVPSPNLWKSQMFRQVLDFFVFGFVDPDPKELWFSLDPIIYELQKANRESLEFCWKMKQPWNVEKKPLQFAVCKKTPAWIFQNWEKTLVAIFYLDPDSQVPERHKVGKNF